MGFLNDLSDSIINTTKDVGKMAQNAGDMTKLQYDKKVKESEISKIYEDLGRKYYAEHKDSAEEGEFEELEAALNRLEEINNEIMEKKGGKACPKCGTLIKSGAQFCSNCGEKVNDMFED